MNRIKWRYLHSSGTVIFPDLQPRIPCSFPSVVESLVPSLHEIFRWVVGRDCEPGDSRCFWLNGYLCMNNAWHHKINSLCCRDLKFNKFSQNECITVFLSSKINFLYKLIHLKWTFHFMYVGKLSRWRPDHPPWLKAVCNYLICTATKYSRDKEWSRACCWVVVQKGEYGFGKKFQKTGNKFKLHS